MSLFIYGIDEILSNNNQVYEALIRREYLALLNPVGWLIALPIALASAVGIYLLKGSPNRLEKQLKRVGRGEILEKNKLLSPKRLEQALKALQGKYIPDGTIMGVDKNTGAEVCLYDVDANLHTLAIGTTGCGKTTALCNIIDGLIKRRLPMIYIDGKGDLELAKRIESQATKAGQRFYLFSMVGLSVKYNPLAFGGKTSKKDRIIALRHWSEEHYKKLAEGYLQTVVNILEKLEIKIDLYTLSQYLEPDHLYKCLREKDLQNLVPQIESLEKKRKDIEGLIAEIENLVQSEIGHLFDCSEGEVLRLDQALSENAIVYFCLQPLAFPTYAENLGKLIINDIKALASIQLEKEIKHPLYVIFDEFSVFAGDQIIHLINQGRSAGIHAVLSTQSLSDIEVKGSKALVGQILNNCNNYLIMRQNNPEDAETLARIIGTNHTFQITTQLDPLNQQSAMGSVKQTREYIMHPDEIKRLNRGEGVLVNKREFSIRYLFVRS